MTEHLISVTHHTTDYRGDHSAEVAYVYDVAPGETVEMLVARLKLQPPDRIELRMKGPKR